jgi:hypothetical protein
VSLNLRDFGFAFSFSSCEEEIGLSTPQDENEKAKPKSLKFKLTVFFLALVTVVGSMDAVIVLVSLLTGSLSLDVCCSLWVAQLRWGW